MLISPFSTAFDKTFRYSNRSVCALGYLFCGFICLDRFTTRAFLATKDPRVTTAIPSGDAPVGVSAMEAGGE